MSSRTLSVLPAMEEQASSLSVPAAMRLEAAAPLPILATISGGPGRARRARPVGNR